MLLAGFSVVADRGMSLYALALIIAVVMLTALSAIPVGPTPSDRCSSGSAGCSR